MVDDSGSTLGLSAGVVYGNALSPMATAIVAMNTDQTHVTFSNDSNQAIPEMRFENGFV
jgi:hypothetical protein